MRPPITPHAIKNKLNTYHEERYLLSPGKMPFTDNSNHITHSHLKRDGINLTQFTLAVAAIDRVQQI